MTAGGYGAAGVLFCALNPGACFAAAGLMPVPSPEDHQFVEPFPPGSWPLICRA